MTNLEIIKELNQLSLQINNLISLLSERPIIDNNEITEDNINDGSTGEELFLGSELQDEQLFNSEPDTPGGEEFEDTLEPEQEIIVDDGEELI